MKLLKRIIAVMAALLIVVNIAINVFAEAAPIPFTPNITVVSGGGNSPVTSFLGELLLGSGVSSDLITDHKGIVDFNKEATEKFTQVYLDTGQYPDTVIAEDGNEYTFGEYMQYLYLKSLEEERDAWYNAMYDMGWNFYDFVHKNEINLKKSFTTDLMGNGAFMDFGDTYGGGCEYVIVDMSNGPNDVRIKMVDSSKSSITGYTLNKDGSWTTCGLGWAKGWRTGYRMLDNGTLISPDGYVIKLYGDVRTIEGEDFPTDDEWEYQVGETPDGTRVTVDMLDPNGTVDGQPVIPDLTQFDKNALLDLIRDMLEASKNTYETADPDNIVNPDDVAVPDVAEELEDFTVSPSIITVFPFCLPFDFVRGMKSLVQKPEAPVFKAELDLTNFCGYDLGKHTIEISFEKWEPAVDVFRWFSILLFTYSLILLTGKIVKGAGA